jgi:hypothetical protein
LECGNRVAAFRLPGLQGGGPPAVDPARLREIHAGIAHFVIERCVGFEHYAPF